MSIYQYRAPNLVLENSRQSPFTGYNLISVVLITKMTKLHLKSFYKNILFKIFLIKSQESFG